MGRGHIYPLELRERPVRMVAEVRPEYPSDWSAICAVASRLGIGPAETLRKWVRQAEVAGGQRPGVTRFANSMLRARGRARRTGTKLIADHTIENGLAIVRDVAVFLSRDRDKNDWALVDVHDIMAFLVTAARRRKRRLTVLRQFFRFARDRKIILADPAAAWPLPNPARSPAALSPSETT